MKQNQARKATNDNWLSQLEYEMVLDGYQISKP